MNQLITILLIIILILFITEKTQVEKFNPQPVFRYNKDLYLFGKDNYLIVTNIKSTNNFQIFELSNRKLFQIKFDDKYVMPIYDHDRLKYMPKAQNATYDSKHNDKYIIKYDKTQKILYYEFLPNISTTKKIRYYFIVDTKTKIIYLDNNINKASKFTLSYE